VIANHRDAARARRVVETEIPPLGRAELIDRGPEDIDQPAQVISRTEMQRSAHQPRSHHRSSCSKASSTALAVTPTLRTRTW